MATKTRLNMDHGFMQIIIKNQLDRDNYDKEMKAKAGKKMIPPSVVGAKTKKPDLNTYAPPRARPLDAIQHKRQEASNESDSYLFTFEYEDESGKLFHLVVNEGDDGTTLARKFGQERNLEAQMIEALSLFLQEQIDKHFSSRNS